jgi:putative transposase
MKAHKAIRIRLYPILEQVRLFQQTAGCCRLVYNLGREQRQMFGRRGRSINYASQCGELRALKKEAPFLKDVPHHCLQQALRNLDMAYSRFFQGLDTYPQPRRKGRDDSFCFPDPAQIKMEGSGRDFRIFLPKAKWVSGVLHRDPSDLFGGAPARLKSVTVSREADWWVASLLFEAEIEAPVGLSPERPIANDILDEAVGIDLGVAEPVVLSDGTTHTLPRIGKGEKRREVRLRRTVARRKKGSANRRKAVRALARFTAHQKRRRRDAREKVTTTLAKSHGTQGIVMMEDLRLRNMSASARGTVEQPGRQVRQKAGLNRSLLDIGMAAFRTRLEQKITARGGLLILVDARNTSRTCPVCGHVAAENRPTRDRFCCVACGHTDHADVNAAGNIRARGLALLGRDQIPTAGGPSVAACGALCDGMAAKQETPRRKTRKKAA